MTALAATRSRVYRMLAAVPPAWRNDPVFRWATIGAGIALVMLAIRISASPISHPLPPGRTSPAAGSWSVPPHSTATLKIAPGRPLAGVTITPTPEDRLFGTVPATARK